MQWEQLLSLRKQGDKRKRLRIEEDETRLGFEVDYDRIIFSTPFRSLQDKTQVVPLSKAGFVHTRLTHSLEVSVVGRSLGRNVGRQILEKYPALGQTHGYKFNDFGAIVAAASLAHDIGNPPFGHSGEKAIGEYFKSGKGKQYKKQLTFSILSQDDLRFTFATLGAFLKYPKPSLPYKPTSHIAHKKYGYFQRDETFFNEVVSDLGLLKQNIEGEDCYFRHPLTYLVEAADDICYTIIDFEDGINLGLLNEEEALDQLIELVKDRLNVKKYGQLNTKADRVSYLRALSIGVLIDEATSIFIKNEEVILRGTFDGALIDHSKFKNEIENIIKISVEKIYQSKEVIEKEITGYHILNTLLDVYCEATSNYHANSQTNYDKLILKTEGDHFDYKNIEIYPRLISICQYVASLTDGNALEKFKKIKGLGI